MISENGILSLDVSTFNTRVEVATAAQPTGMTLVSGSIIVTDASGIYRQRGSAIQHTQLDTNSIDGIVSFAGQAFAYSLATGEAYILSFNQSEPYVIGRFALGIDTNLISISDDLIRSSSGKAWRIERASEDNYQVLYETQRARGASEDVFLHEGSVFSANRGYALTKYTDLPENTQLKCIQAHMQEITVRCIPSDQLYS